MCEQLSGVAIYVNYAILKGVNCYYVMYTPDICIIWGEKTCIMSPMH
jgi:hypothetical protein